MTTGPAAGEGAVAAPLPESMRAWRLHEWGSRPRLDTVPVPVPAEGEVLLRVDAAGLCHSDLHIMDAPEGRLPYELPFTLGHEVVGTAVRVGAGVDDAVLGRTYAVHGVWSCGRCRACRAGRDNYCAELGGAIGGGIGRDGGLAEYMLVPAARHLVPVGDGDPTVLAPLTDAGLTAYHAVVSQSVPPTGAVVVVVGVGGLGHLALQVLRTADPAAVVAVDTNPDARALALRLGADVAVGAVEEAAGPVAEYGEGAGADLVFDFVGAQTTMDAAARLLATGGTLVVVGSAGGRLTVDKQGSVPRGWTVDAPFWGPAADLAAVVELAARGDISAVADARPLGAVGRAYDDLRAGAARGRIVAVPALDDNTGHTAVEPHEE